MAVVFINIVSVVFPVNPPAPVPCPIGGRYSFVQEGAPEEMFTTRIRGITERPRHLIDCMEFVSEFKSCDNNPKKIYVDAEYCATLDHTAKPIGEYGEFNSQNLAMLSRQCLGFHVLQKAFSYSVCSSCNGLLSICTAHAYAFIC